MTGDIDRARQRFQEAVMVLAASAGSLRERVQAAWVEVSALGDTHVPLELHGEFAEMTGRWRSADAAGSSDSIEAAARALSDEDAVTEARRIVEWAFRLAG